MAPLKANHKLPFCGPFSFKSSLIKIPNLKPPSRSARTILLVRTLKSQNLRLSLIPSSNSIRSEESEREDSIKMHSFWFRLNALLTLSVTVLGIICALASFSDNFNHPSPSAIIEVLKIHKFQKLSSGNDEVKLTLNVTADLQSLFTWNTKQVFVFVAAEYETPKNAFNQISLWDAIIPSQEHAKFSIRTSNKYKFIDQGSNLLGKEFNLTLHWHVMPKTGKMFADTIVKTGYRFPEEYR